MKAGEAYLRAIENDPDSKAALMRARMELQAVANAMNSPEFREALEADRRAWQEWLDALRTNLESAGDELEAQHLPRPATLEDWEELGRIVEIPENYLKTGKWTASEIFQRALAWAKRQSIRAKLVADAQADRDPGRPAASVDTTSTSRKTKRSTERGEGRAKLVAALTKHHNYADRGCLNLEPIGNNKLAEQAGVAKRTASAFFDKEFQGHARYRALCNDAPRLVAALKALNGEFRPRDFYDARTPDDVEREGE